MLAHLLRLTLHVEVSPRHLAVWLSRAPRVQPCPLCEGEGTLQLPSRGPVSTRRSDG